MFWNTYFVKNKKKSQFFLTYAKHNTLDMKYTVFGKMIDGDETLDAIEKVLIDPKVLFIKFSRL